MSAAANSFVYRLAHRLRGHADGSHPALHAGAGDEYLASRVFVPGVDARRLDLQRSLRDPFAQLWVWQHRARVRVPVVVIADVSGSMGFEGATSRAAMLLQLTEAAARSALRRGDPFSLVACDAAPRRELFCPQTRSRSLVARALAGLRAHRPERRDARGLLQASRHLPARRCLILLVSDMQLPAPVLVPLLRSLARHEVHACLLDDSAERAPRGRGLVRLADLETGGERLLWVRGGTQAALRAAHAQRVAAFEQACRRSGASSLVITDRVDVAQLTRHFAARGLYA